MNAELSNLETGSAQRIAIFAPSMAGGGAERVMATVANGAASMGHPVDLVLATRTGPYLDEIGPEVNIVDLNASRVATSLVPLVRYLRTQRPTVVLSALTHANVAALLAACLCGRKTRIVVSERDAVFPVARRLTARLRRRLTAAMYRRADLILAVSEGVRQDVIREYATSPARVRTVYNPLDIAEIERLSELPTNHGWLEHPDRPVFLAVGRLETAKGFDILIAAFAKMRSEVSARLIILGEGSLRNTLIDHAASLGIADDVDFPGFQSNPFSWMARSDVFVLSSRNEGLPNALIQAMVCGSRVVSTDCPHGPSEILEDGRWGVLVPVGDVDALATAMHQALNPSNAPAVRERAQAFSKDALVRKYLALLQGQD